MNDQMLKLLATATALAPIVAAIVEVMKRYTGAEGKMLPILGIFAGIAIGGLWGLSFAQTELVAYLWSGLIAGLASVGVFELVKKDKTMNQDERPSGQSEMTKDDFNGWSD